MADDLDDLCPDHGILRCSVCYPLELSTLDKGGCPECLGGLSVAFGIKYTRTKCPLCGNTGKVPADATVHGRAPGEPLSTPDLFGS